MSGWGEVSKAFEGCGKIGDSCNHKIVGAGIRHEDAVGEPLDGISDTRCGGGGDVNVITAEEQVRYNSRRYHAEPRKPAQMVYRE